MYLYQKSSDYSRSLLSSWNVFRDKKAEESLSLDPVRECQLHESAGIDDYDRDVTGVWITTDTIKEPTYMSIEKIKTISYIDDVNPVKYDMINIKHSHPKHIENDWIDLGDNDDDKKDLEDEEGDEEDEHRENDKKLNQEVESLRFQHRSSLKLIEDLRAENSTKQQKLQRLSNELREKSMSPQTPVNTNVASLNQQCLEQRKFSFYFLFVLHAI